MSYDLATPYDRIQLVATALRNLSTAVITGHDLDVAQADAERALEVVVDYDGDVRPLADDELLRWRSP